MKRLNQKKYVGVKEIAYRANVSIATVDRVLHNRPGVAPHTKRKIERIIKEIDYKPNIIASRLASSKIYYFAVLIPQISDETDFWQAPLDGIERAKEMIGELGINIEYYFFNLKDRSSFQNRVDEVLKTSVDGVLLAPSFVQESQMAIEQFQEKNIPYVLIDSYVPNVSSLSYIGPDLHNSGLVAGQLIDMVFGSDGKFLIINIAKEVDDHIYLSEIEKGFKSYFKNKYLPPAISRLDITLTDHTSITRILDDFLIKNDFPKAILVTNSRVSAIARYFENSQIKPPFIIGYDYISKNLEYLEKGIIDILICHKSEEQGYKGIMTLYQNLVLGEPVDNMHYMPIDILTKENYKFYKN